MAVEIISTAGQAHLVRAFYSVFYRDVIWIYLLQSCRRCCGQKKEKSAKRRVILSLKDLKLRILRIELSGRHKLRMFVLNMSDTYFEMWWERREWSGGLVLELLSPPVSSNLYFQRAPGQASPLPPPSHLSLILILICDSSSWTPSDPPDPADT